MTVESLLGRFADPILTKDPAQRLRLVMCFGAATTYLLYAALLGAQIVMGLAPQGPTLALIAAELTIAPTFYFIIRSGLNLKLRSDPSLAIPQLVTGYLFTLGAYALVGLAAPALMMVIASQMVYVVFSLPPRTVHRMATAALLGLGLTMLACHAADPLRYPAATQAVTFAYACLIIPIIASMAHRVAVMNERQRASRRELQEALAKVQELATRDSLTKLHNRRHLTELLEAECARQRRHGGALSIALLDLDLFKSINDRFGHQAGDQVLCRFAALAKDVLRESDLLGRWGGEEFLAVFPDTPALAAMQALERLRERVAAEDFSDIAPELSVSFSAGLAVLRADEPLEHAVERADQAMYRAKTSGRDRCLAA